MKRLVCIYTCQHDADKLELFKNTTLYSRILSDPSTVVIEVYAGSPETKYLDGKLYLSCNESYGELSVKTYEMIKYCVSNFEFDVLIKIDSTIIGYDVRLNMKLGNGVSDFVYNLTDVEKMLFSDSWFDDHGDYGGVVLYDSPDEHGLRFWGVDRSVSLPITYDANFQPSSAYYTGKFYFMSKKLCEYVMENGEELARSYVKNLGGSEDVFIGNLFGKYIDNIDWHKTRISWKTDNSAAKNQTLPIHFRHSMIKTTYDVLPSHKLVIMSCRHNRDDVAYLKRVKFGCSAIICDGNRQLYIPRYTPQLDYLNYIIENYDRLPQCMVFINDELFSPTTRTDDPVYGELAKFVSSVSSSVGFLSLVNTRRYPTEQQLVKFKSKWVSYMDEPPPTHFMGVPIFCISKDLVLSKPKSWYYTVRTSLCFAGEEFVELFGFSWRHIFLEKS